jgi:hypothetical protein
LKYYNAANNILSVFDDPVERPVFKITTEREGGQGDNLFLKKTVVELAPTSASASASPYGVSEKNDIVQGEIDWRVRTITIGDVSMGIDETRQMTTGG